MVGRLVSFWDGPLSGAMLVSGRVPDYTLVRSRSSKWRSTHRWGGTQDQGCHGGAQNPKPAWLKPWNHVLWVPNVFFKYIVFQGSCSYIINFCKQKMIQWIHIHNHLYIIYPGSSSRPNICSLVGSGIWYMDHPCITVLCLVVDFQGTLLKINM